MKERQRWQPEEDALLRAYVKQYGAKEWNLVSQRMGKPLHRDAKSCLERWKNYLKPGIKKGSLTPEEQTLVISLQAKYGNKWKKIASEVPGRTAKRLGKWWEVFKEKQLKDNNSNNNNHRNHHQHHDQSHPILLSSSSDSVHSQYDHILQTFAEKYVQPNLPPHHPMGALAADAPPILSLAGPAEIPPPPSSSSSSLPPWLSSSVSTSSSSTASPSVSLTLSPTEPAGEMAVGVGRMIVPVQQAAALVQCCKEVEEGRQSWVQQKKEAAWRVSRLEQQLESEKARKRREKTEEVEAKIRALRDEERTYIERVESECREQLSAIQRDADAKEAKLVEMWAGKHLKLLKLVEQISVGVHHHR